MRIGFDVDGVLASFNDSFVPMVIKVTQRNLFPPEWWDRPGHYGNLCSRPPCWNYPQHFGYTNEECESVWNEIDKSNDFWRLLKPIQPNFDDTVTLYNYSENDIYFITNRPKGIGAKWQTEYWLQLHGIDSPTVIISDKKGMLAHALNLQLYIDDKWENCADVVGQSPTTHTYLLDAPYNRLELQEIGFKRVKTIAEMFSGEGL